ncbi:nuclear envelope morphology protein 1-like [Vigna radiata var. radiata]|uniref:Mitochondrial import inner membrane translocase subunit TIM50 n=1 Tax=Vigna radiata var. radiata TaxID=3916 RepID=A0A3Q0EXU3_VIGRR|nr:nuclear envelope morphology protein 1-like [Vigna radiata var. radiata]
MVFFSLKKRLSGIADCNFEEFRGSFQQLHDVLWFNSFLALPVIPSTREFQIINSNHYQHTFPKNSLDAWSSSVCHKTCKKRSSATLVLDLDETLVHSSEFPCNADFTFKMKSRTIYVKKRPYLEEFLEKVSEMFEVVIFTASTRSYSAKLLDILDPHNKFFSRRLYRDSCKWEDGHCLKDLRLLGIDMAKVFIIDNTPRGIFVSGYVSIAHPLTDLLKKYNFLWNNIAYAAFADLKNALSTAPVLAISKFDSVFTVQTNASGIDMGEILSQQGHPIAYFIEQLCPKLQNSSTYNT